MVFFVFVSFMMGLIICIQIHPEISQKLGLIGTKASLLRFGEPNWKNYLALLLQGISAIGLIGFGFITSWVFGREYTENTLKDILALPVSRSTIVSLKIIDCSIMEHYACVRFRNLFQLCLDIYTVSPTGQVEAFSLEFLV